MLRYLVAAVPAADNTASLLALIGVVAAAFLTALGGIITSYLSRKRDREADGEHTDEHADVHLLTVAYSDCRTDLAALQERVSLLEFQLAEARADLADAHAALAEARAVGELVLREVADHHPKTDPLEPLP